MTEAEWRTTEDAPALLRDVTPTASERRNRLEDAGCDDADLLAHCRTGTDHARGCWALGAVLELR